MIHKDKCLELGLPEPKSYHDQTSYVQAVMLHGIKLNTRKARFIGIHNLHSIVSKLKRKGFPFTLEHGVVWCPFTNILPPQPVDIVYMTPEQLREHEEKKSRKES